MKIAVRGGHTPASIGAIALLNELTEDRKVKTAVIKYLQNLGHTVKDVTPGDAVSYPAELNAGINSANNWGADLFVSIHFNKAYNSYNGTIGSEVCVYKSCDEAKRVVNKLASLGFKNRGQKVRTDLGELKRTNMKSMIIEVCFVEATEDVKLYKKLGADAIGKAIAEGIANKNINLTPPQPPSNNNSLKTGDRVDITGDKYTTGQTISSWAKTQVHTISKINGDRALLKEINSWCYLKDLKLNSSKKALKVGDYVKMNGTKWATGEQVSSWVKGTKYKVKQIKGDRVLLDSVISWAYIKDLIY